LKQGFRKQCFQNEAETTVSGNSASFFISKQVPATEAAGTV
jgi:hypothetical protein